MSSNEVTMADALGKIRLDNEPAPTMTATIMTAAGSATVASSTPATANEQDHLEQQGGTGNTTPVHDASESTTGESSPATNIDKGTTGSSNGFSKSTLGLGGINDPLVAAKSVADEKMPGPAAASGTAEPPRNLDGGGPLETQVKMVNRGWPGEKGLAASMWAPKGYVHKYSL